MNWILVFKLCLGIWLWIMPLAVFCQSKTSMINRWIFTLLFRNKISYGNIVTGGGWYFTMNTNLMIHFFTFIKIIGIIVSCSSIMIILFIFIIRCRLIMWLLLLSMIIINGTGWFERMLTLFWNIFTRAVQLMLYKYSQK